MWLSLTLFPPDEVASCRDYRRPLRDAPPPKKRENVGISPPVWEPHVCEKKLWFILHFRTLGTFLVFTKMFTFWVVLWFGEVGTGDPPPPQAKNSHFIPFC